MCARTSKIKNAGCEAVRSNTREVVQLCSRGDREMAVEDSPRRRRHRPIGHFNAQVVPPSAQQRRDVIQSCKDVQPYEGL